MKQPQSINPKLEDDLRFLFEEQGENIEEATRCLKVLSHPARLKILCALRGGEMNVQELEHLTSLKQATLSQHLSLLKAHDVLQSRREANYSYYRIANDQYLRLFDMLKNMFCGV
jgi:ArsR family transcriptional regulator